jgi:aryl-alcohol dehydrogenase-like predicted oxidoreductase
VNRRRLGSAGPEVSALGLGCMGMSGSYGPADRAEGIATIRAALDAGVDLIDTGDFYGMGHNEMLIGEAVRGRRRDSFLLSVKFGGQRGPEGAILGYDASPAATKTALAYSLTRLGVEYIDIYRPARLDPDVPIEETVGGMAELVDEGKVRHLGLSEVSADTLRKACAVHPIAALQSEWSLWSRDLENEIVPTCRELGIGIVPFSPLGRGFLTGRIRSFDDLPERDMRRAHPRFRGDAFDANLSSVDVVRAIADEHGVKAGQVAIAWLLAKGPDVVPIPGTKRIAYLEENLGAVDVQLSSDDIARLDAVTAVGPRSLDPDWVNRSTPSLAG